MRYDNSNTRGGGTRLLILISVAIAPSLALFSYFYLRRDIESEPTRLLFNAFMYGAFITFPILFVQYIVQEETALSAASIWSGPFSGILEEFFKWLILLIGIFKQTRFSDPYDGILYGASVSLGFATIENLLFLINFGIQDAFLRALLPVSSHALFGVVMGYYMGKAQFTVIKQKTQLLIALVAPLILHISYNLILFTHQDQMLIWSVFMLFMWLFALSRVKQAHLLSRKYRMENHPFYHSVDKP